MKIVANLLLALSATALCTAAFANDNKATPASTKAAKPAAGERAAAQEAGRNWSAIDSNKDGLISPEEMEAYLKANPGPLKGK